MNSATHKFACDGWWEQDGFGRQPMNRLQLELQQDSLVGSGEDVIGDFELSGTVANGQVVINKQYLDAHCVRYVGQWDGEGTYHGHWSISGVGGRWAIRILRTDAASDIISL